MSAPVLIIDVAHAAWHAVRESAGNANPFAVLLARIAALSAEHERVILALDSPPYDRAALLPSYKAHRTSDPEARALVGRMLDGLRASGKHVIAEVPGAEADDVCATIALWCAREGIPCTVATSDKDLWPLVDLAAVWDLRSGEPITPEKCMARWGVDPKLLHDLLALAGDLSDGVPGVPGIGEKKAAALLTRVGALWEILGMEPKRDDEIEFLSKDADKASRAAKKAEKDKAPEAETLRLLAQDAAVTAWIAKQVALVHQHRAAVELAREVIRLRDDLPIDCMRLLAPKGESDGGVGDQVKGERSLPHQDRGVAHLRAVAESRDSVRLEEERTEGVPGMDGAQGRALAPAAPTAARAAAKEAEAETTPREEKTVNDIAEAEIETPVRTTAPLAVRQPEPAAPKPQSILVEQTPVRHAGPPATLLRTSPEIAALAEALAKAQGEIEHAEKTAENNHTRKRYADLAAVWRAVRAPLSKHGLSVVQVATGGHLISRLLHSSGQWIEADVKIALDTATGRTPVQALGSALTYLRRYVLSGLVGVAPDDDDDGNSDGRAIPPARRSA